ncbi:MAG TPA: GDSL-type esterase/lipase family protein [Gemmatimonadales bacterium]|nr:GDSL-type esterase/lipase family protein [Gemmatimonadales bacterium]
MPPWRARLALVGLSLTVTLVAAELALRATTLMGLPLGNDLRHKDPAAVQIEPLGTSGFRQRPGSRFTYANNSFASVNALGYRGPPVAIPKPPGVLRIVLLGGSTTHGWSVSDSQTIDTYLRAALGQRHPELAAEVVNLAFDGYDSYQILLRWREDAIRFAPDLLIVNAGATDVGHARYANLVDADPRVLLWQAEVKRLRDEAARGRRSMKDSIKHWLYLARLPQYLRELAWRRSNAAPPAGRPPLYPDVADYFERHIRQIALEALASHIAVLLSTDPSALRYRQAPGSELGRAYFLIDATTTQAYRDTLAKRMAGIAESLAGPGVPIRYLGVDSLPPEDFMDDAHLTPAGNRDLAARFLDAIEPLLPRQPTGR